MCCEINHLHDTYIDMKSSKWNCLYQNVSWQTNRIKKTISKILSQNGLIDLFCSLYYQKAAAGFLPSLVYQCQDKQTASLSDSCITHWFELFYKSSLILDCQHLQRSSTLQSAGYLYRYMYIYIYIYTYIYIYMIGIALLWKELEKRGKKADFF